MSSSQKETTEREFVNWIKGSTGLVITKVAVCKNIINTWKSELESWEEDEILHLHYLLEDISKDEVAFVKERNSNTKKKIWKIKCECPLCKKVFDRLRKYHRHESKKIVWNPELSSNRSKLYSEVEKFDYVEYFNEICYICKKRNCPFERNRNGVPLFEEKIAGPMDESIDQCIGQSIDEYYWKIASMFMYRGRERGRNLS